MVRINRVYTRSGDAGQTSLIGGERVDKSSLRIECYGTVDELNATLGLARTALEELAGDAGPDEGEDRAGDDAGAAGLVAVVGRVQNELFNLGAQLATPDPERRQGMPAIAERHVRALEADIDRLNSGLPELKSFILPGGGWASAYFHVARTVCRRAERLVVALDRSGAGIDTVHIEYLNRLSDALFVFGRVAALAAGRSEPLWQPETT